MRSEKQFTSPSPRVGAIIPGAEFFTAQPHWRSRHLCWRALFARYEISCAMGEQHCGSEDWPALPSLCGDVVGTVFLARTQLIFINGQISSRHVVRPCPSFRWNGPYCRAQRLPTRAILKPLSTFCAQVHACVRVWAKALRFWTRNDCPFTSLGRRLFMDFALLNWI